MSLPDFYSLRCRTHFKALLRVDFDRVDGALFVRCATDGELLGVYRVRPKGCECLSPSQREGRS